MKVLLDEHLPLRLRRFLPGHDVFTVEYQGWKGTRNGDLLSAAVAAGCEAFITMDDPITSEQKLA
jgi:predicted nuclease of predicted toxin-antitoxin system